MTLEALSSYAALETLRHLRAGSSYQESAVTVRAEKPSALVFASSAEVEVTRTFTDYPEFCPVVDNAVSGVCLLLTFSSLY